MPGTYTPLNEWCDENQHRQFPLTDDSDGRDNTGSFTLPQTLLCDLFFCIPPGADNTKFFIDLIVVRRYSVDIYFSYEKPDTSVIRIGSVTGIPYNAGRNSVYYLSTEQQALTADQPFELMTGAVVIGSMAAVLEHPGAWSFERAAATIISTRLSEGLAVLHSIGVGNSIFTGNIRLKEGANITIRPTYDALTGITTLTIAADVGSIEDISIPLTSDAAIIQALTQAYGRPIETINGIQGDSSGNFRLIEADCTDITDSAGDFGVIIDNPCALPCCDKSHLENIYQDISELNLRYARMESYYEAISRNVNALQALLIGLEI